jgi:hypothetical protein
VAHARIEQRQAAIYGPAFSPAIDYSANDHLREQEDRCEDSREDQQTDE